jgi:hypothetical protein
MLTVTIEQLEAANLWPSSLERLGKQFGRDDQLTLEHILICTDLRTALFSHHACPEVTKEQQIELSRKVLTYVSAILFNAHKSALIDLLGKGLALAYTHVRGYEPEDKASHLEASYEAMRIAQWSNDPWAVDLAGLVYQAVLVTDQEPMFGTSEAARPYAMAQGIAIVLDEALRLTKLGHSVVVKCAKADFTNFFRGEAAC